MIDSLEIKWERYLEGLKHQRACNILQEDPGVDFYGRMDSLWNSLSPEEQDDFDRRWEEVRSVLDSPPSAPGTLGMVDRIAGNGMAPRMVVNHE